MHPSGEFFLDDLRYPVGGFSPGSETRAQAVQAIADLPARLRAALLGLSASQLDTLYREDGWTLRQLTHHVADSHMHAVSRLRFALTEDWPVIQAYDEKLWAALPDARTLPVEVALDLLTPLHGRWTALLAMLPEADWQRGYVHPESGRTTVETMTEMYSWHSRHHTAHVLHLRERRGW